MRRVERLGLGIVLAATLGASASGKEPGRGDAYRIVGEMAVQDNGRETGRSKPLDSLARLIVKQVYSRESIKVALPEAEAARKAAETPAWKAALLRLRGQGPEFEMWSPLAAYLDWQARPEFWDEQEIIAVEYLPLKQALLSASAHDALGDLARSGVLAAADREKVERAAKDPDVTSGDLKAAALLPGVPEKAKQRLLALSHKLSPDQKWLSPDDLEDAEVEVGGKRTPFLLWIAEIQERPSPNPMIEEPAPRTPIEKKAEEAAEKLLLYQAARDGNARGIPHYDVFAFPRPVSPAYLKYTTEVKKKLMKASESHAREAEADLSPMQRDSLLTLSIYLKDVSRREWRDPGEDAEFDAKYVEWLRDKSAWVPLRVILKEDLGELSRAGFDESKIVAFRKAFAALIAAEKADPGKLPVAEAQDLVASARALGESVSVPYLLAKDARHKTWEDLKPARVAAFVAARDPLATTSASPSPEVATRLIAAGRDLAHGIVAYPSVAEMGREVDFNYQAPFYKAFIAYGIASVLLLIALGLDARPHTGLAKLDSTLYGLGMAAMASGIGLEVLGFYYRVRITGWAPVTNMYETVVWVGLVTAVLGLVLEAIYRKKYSALSASTVAFLATLLAANVSLLDPEIKSLQPVLRSNYWLTIHVLTIVSSYAAFALAMGLGLLGLGFYLSATYRRDVPYAELARPLAPGLPLLIGGVVGLLAHYYGAGGAFFADPMVVKGLAAIAIVGMMGTIIGGLGLIGEAANRKSSRTMGAGLAVTVAGLVGVGIASSSATPDWWPHPVPLWLGPVVVTGLGVITVVLARLGSLSRSAMIQAESLSQPIAVAEPFIPGPSFEPIGSVATQVRPTVAAIRARQEALGTKLDPRSQSMQATAARIKPLSNFLYRAMQVGVLLVAAGTILGGVWADFSWGRFWGWDAKEVWALITLLVYLVPLHGRFAGWVNTFGLVAASVFCFASVLMAWYGVNFVLATGLHSYGFVEGGGQGIVLTCSLAVMATVFAAGRRRKLASIA